MATAEERLEAIQRELAGLGPTLPGSISQRSTRCQRSGCHCRVEPSVLHGPYPTWTWRVQGVALTRTLTAEQASVLQPYADAHRRLKELVTELEQVSIELIEQSSGVDLGSKTVGKRRARAGR